LGVGHDDPNCIFYRGQAACTGWGYWYRNQYAKVCSYACGTFHYLIGYENNSVFRSVDIFDTTIYVTVAPSDVGMGGYLKAHITYWSGNRVQVLRWSYG
jgi:hypothetical protein